MVTTPFAGLFSALLCYARARGFISAPRIPAVCELLGDARARLRIAEGLRPDRDQVCAGGHQVFGMTPALHPSHADDRYGDPGTHLAHLGERDGPQSSRAHACSTERLTKALQTASLPSSALDEC